MALARMSVALGLVAVLTAAAAPTLFEPRSTAVRATPDPATAVEWAGGWLARQVTADVGVAAHEEATARTVLGLTAAEVGAAARARAAAWLESRAASWIVDSTGTTRPERAGLLALAAVATGADPHAYGPAGVDLVAAITASQQSDGPDAGLYGTSDPFQAVGQHALAVLGLAAAGTAPDERAAAWLLAQQCSDGGWPTYRDPATRPGPTCEIATPDAASTSAAVQAVAVLNVTPQHEVEPFLRALQTDAGGFAPQVGRVESVTATVAGVRAVTALTGALPDASWERPGGHPVGWLLAEQRGCAHPGSDRGAFGTDGGTDAGLTADAVLALAAAPLPVPAGTPVTGDPFPPCPVTSTRLGGDSRIETAVTIAWRAHPEGADTVVLASAAAVADALAGGPLAAALDAPLLLTDGARLTPSTAAAVQDLGATEAVLLGGEAVISQRVADDLRTQTAVADVRRISGADRYATAAAIAAELDADEAFLAVSSPAEPGRGWPDALAVGPLAGALRAPLLLTAPERLPDVTRAALADRARVTVVGGGLADSVREEVATEVEELVVLAGRTRYETAEHIAYATLDAGLDPSRSWLATGTDWADALAAVPAVAGEAAVLMLVDGHDLAASPPTSRYLAAVDHTVDELVLAGGEAAITASVAADLHRTVRPS